ncbi:hypothetical protein LPICM17_110045 [Lactococcus piscium]|nr:hypothetical protein LPICM17_110045 [Lactococcus piscium]
MAKIFDDFKKRSVVLSRKSKKGYKAYRIKEMVHNYDEHAKNDETSPRFTKKYEGCAS